MALFGFFEKKYSDWSMDTGDGARADFSKKALEKGVGDVCRGREEFLILTAKESFSCQCPRPCRDFYPGDPGGGFLCPPSGDQHAGSEESR